MSRTTSTANWVRVALIALIVFAAYGFVSEVDYRAELMEQAHYCRMVEAGHWPAYRPAHNNICKETDHEPE